MGKQKQPTLSNQQELFPDLPSSAGDVKVLRSLQERERTAIVPPAFTLCTEIEQLEECAQEIKRHGEFSLDTETNGLYWFLPSFCVVATGIYVGDHAYVIPNRMAYCTRNFGRGEMEDALGDVLTDSRYRKILHNAKFDAHAIYKTFGLDIIQGIAHDSMIAAWILDENVRHSLEDQVELYLDSKPWKIKQDGKFEVWPLKMATLYLGNDVKATYDLYRFQVEHLSKQPKLYALMYELEMPHLRVIAEMERNGIAWDQDYYENVMFPEIMHHYNEATKLVHSVLGPININSPQQLAAALFDGLGIERVKRDKEGNLTDSTDKRVLAKLKGVHPVIGYLETWRKYATLKKMFGDQLPTYVVNKRIHTNANCIGTVTGRLSNSDPNLQQIPKAAIGPLIRKGFVPSPGHVLVTFDYSQIELRILAHLANDQKMIDAFKSGMDFHTATAHNMFHVPIADLEADKDMPQRVTAKNVNFGIPYGIGGPKLEDTVNIRLSEMGVDPAQFLKEGQGNETIDRWYAAYPGAAAWLSAQEELVRQQGYVETLFGRKRRLYNEMQSPVFAIRSSGERKAKNSPIQGSSADLIKKATIIVVEKIKELHYPYRLLLSIHDELIFEVPLEWLQHNRDSVEVLKSTMEHAVELRVPLKVSADILQRWGDKLPEDDLDIEEEAA